MILERFNVDIHSHLIEPLTELLHKAYAPLAAQGMKYLATHQPASKTLDRLGHGESHLGFVNREIVSTLTLRPERPNSPCEYYRKPGVFSLGQFAVSPEYQGRGYGAKIMDFVETRAKELGAKELALDTSEKASELIAMYERRGYKIVGHTQWEVTNYCSIVMSKTL